MFGSQPASIQGLDSALGSLLGGGQAKSAASLLLEQQQSGGHHLHPGLPFGSFGSGVFGPGLPRELGAESSDDLITPGSVEVQAGGGLQVSAAPQTGPPPPRQQCLFCSRLGSQNVCGPLRPAIIDGGTALVHHLCAIWTPGCYLPEGTSAYVNLAAEAKQARQRSCSACGQRGAAITCAHSGCRCAYHLPCALGAPNVLLENESFELWCPHHSDTDNSDEDYAFTAPRPRRRTGGSGSGSKRQRGLVEAQRPRTDWQKKDENTWLKVVPPWWCENRTVHFATKVFKELFRSASGAVIVDPTGTEWQCMVHSEARNDLRPQYTLRGAFAELWESLGISAGDTLVFKRDPLTGSIELARHAASSATKAEEGTESDLSDPAAMMEGAGGRVQRAAARQEASSEQTRGQSQQGSHPNRWMELTDGWNIKTVYKSTMAHQQCPIAGWLFKKLYGRLPGDSDKAAMYDPDLDTEYRFDVTFIGAANVHYITGKIFGSWVRESGLQAGEQIRIKKEGGRVVIQRVPSDRKVRVDFTTKTASRSVSLAQVTDEAAMAGAPASYGQELASPPTAQALEALDALVAAAGYAGTHGTPAIQAALAGSGGPAAAAAAIAMAGLPPVALMQQQGFEVPVLQPLASPKRRRTAQAESDDASELLQQEQQLLLTRRQHSSVPAAWRASVSWQRGPPAPPSFSLCDWQPSELRVQMYQVINHQILVRHQWSSEEQAILQRFRAKYAWLDGCGREVVYLTATQLQADKAALLSFAAEVGRGILTQVQNAPPAEAMQAAHATPSGLPGTRPNTGGSPFPAPPSLPPAAELQQHAAAAALAGPEGAAAPRALDESHLGLEAAASFNLDALMCTDREAQETPHMQIGALVSVL